ncbi:MAG: hypothetical protein NZ528_12210 [Caldilineales bacterium]|nr:hypothetical protein [Caldilineales bacterium]MDW8316966.1 hypothetical protein [Anaerolineae bacterium]
MHHQPGRVTRFLGAVALLAAWLLIPSLPAHADDVSVPGPYQAGRTSVRVTRPDGTQFDSWLYYPATARGDNTPYNGSGAPYPGVSFGHGYLTDPNYYRSTLEHLATWGYFVMATRSALDLFPSHSRYAQDLSSTLTYLEQQNANPSSWLYNQVAVAQGFGLSGHSMGGGASILAAANDPRVAALANLAAAETNPSATAAMANVRAPARLIAGSRDTIVPYTTTQAMYLNGRPPRQFALLDGGWHCGFLDSYLIGCDAGPMPRSQQLQLTRQLLTEFFNLYLKDQQPLWRQVWGPERNSLPQTTLTSDPGVGLAPANVSGVAFLGGVITYTLTLTNAGPLTTALTPLAEDNAWPVSFSPPQTAALAPGQAAAVVVQVSPPPAAGATTETALVSARREADGGTRNYGFVTTQAVPLALNAQATPAGLALSWTVATAACAYEVHRDTAAYSPPTPATRLTTVAGSSYLDSTSGLGNPSLNHFYLVRAVCGAAAVTSNRVGEFDFGLTPGGS